MGPRLTRGEGSKHASPSPSDEFVTGINQTNRIKTSAPYLLFLVESAQAVALLDGFADRDGRARRAEALHLVNVASVARLAALRRAGADAALGVVSVDVALLVFGAFLGAFRLNGDALGFTVLHHALVSLHAVQVAQWVNRDALGFAVRYHALVPLHAVQIADRSVLCGVTRSGGECDQQHSEDSEPVHLQLSWTVGVFARSQNWEMKCSSFLAAPTAKRSDKKFRSYVPGRFNQKTTAFTVGRSNVLNTFNLVSWVAGTKP
ncbi:hypothetical protein ON010_g80 [Phytophthora cinnamomi]|nr:hypothetical protein ON010_g80 [Phytophthora cinnamomi]